MARCGEKLGNARDALGFEARAELFRCARDSTDAFAPAARPNARQLGGIRCTIRIGRAARGANTRRRTIRSSALVAAVYVGAFVVRLASLAELLLPTAKRASSNIERSDEQRRKNGSC